MLRPGREGERGRRSGDEGAVRARLGARRGDQRDLRRPLQPASAHVLRPACSGRATRRSSTSSTRSWATGRATTARSTSATRRRPSSMPTSSAASGSTTRSTCVRPGVTTDKIAEVWPTAQEIGMKDERAAFGLQFGHGLGVGLYECSDDLAAPLAGRAGRARGRHGLRTRDLLSRPRDGRSAARIEEEVIVTPTGPQGDHPVPGRRAARRRPHLRARRRLRREERDPANGGDVGTPTRSGRRRLID